MTDGNGTVSGIVAAAGVFGTLAIAGGAGGSDAGDYVQQNWPECGFVGLGAAVAFFFGNWGDGAAQLSGRQLVGQTVMTFLLSASLPPVHYTYAGTNARVGTLVLMAFAGSLFAYTLYNAGSVWVKAQRDNGTLLGTAWRFLKLFLGRLTAAIPDPPVAPSNPVLTLPLKPGVSVEVREMRIDGHPADAPDRRGPDDGSAAPAGGQQPVRRPG